MSNFLISITRTSEIFSSVEINISAGGFNAEWIVVSYKEINEDYEKIWTLTWNYFKYSQCIPLIAFFGYTNDFVTLKRKLIKSTRRIILFLTFGGFIINFFQLQEEKKKYTFLHSLLLNTLDWII